MNEFLKVIAAAVLILGGGYIGILASSVFSVREKQLNRLIAIITRMDFNMGFLHMNIADAMSSAAGCEKSAVCKVFRVTAERIRHDGIPPAVALENVFRDYNNEFCLTADDKTILLEFAENLGIGDTESECNNIKAACAKLTVASSEAKGEVEQRGKLWRGLGFLGGIFTAIILF